MERFPQSRSKSNEEIQTQIQKSEEMIGVALELDQTKNLSIEEIKTRYPERYSAYLQGLRAERNGAPDSLEKTREWIQSLNNLDTYIANHQENLENRVLREKQFTIFEDIRNSLEEGKKEGYIKVPTGVGKTVLFSQVVESMGVKTLIVVPSKILVGQTGDKMEEFTDTEFGKYYQEVKDFSKPVTIITYKSLLIGIANGTINPSDYGALILDEVHKALGEKTSEAIKKFDCVKLGFTATPKYSDERQVKNILEHEIHNMSIVEAVKDGLISRFKSIFARTETDLSEVKIDHGGYDEEDLEKTVNNHGRNLSAVQLYKESFNGQSAVAYCSGVTHAETLAALYNEHGIPATTISGDTSEEDREKILQKYESGEIKVLCNARVLIEGFDAPWASVAFNLHPTLSKVDAEQRAGRVLRLDKNNPEKWAYIVDFIDKNARRPQVTFPEVAEASEQEPEEKNTSKNTLPIERDIVNKKTSNSWPKDVPNIDGLKIILDTEEVMQMAKELESGRQEESVPEGWLNTNGLAKIIKRDAYKIKDTVEKYRKSNPEWFKSFQVSTHISEYYHPDLIEKIKEDLYVHLEPITGWQTPNALRGEIGGALSTIKSEAENYRKEHPDWFKNFVNKSQLIEYYSPELIVAIKNGLKAPEGWEDVSQISSELKVDRSTITNYIEQYRLAHPDWFKDFKSTRNYSEYYHPELVSLIKKNIKTETPDENWVNASQLVGKIGIAFGTVKKFVEKYRDSHKEWFKNYQQGTKQVEYYSPEFVAVMQQELVVPPPEPGWVSANKLGTDYNIAPKTIMNFAENYRNSNPDWFKKFKTSGKVAEHYSPELIDIIKKSLKK